MPIQVEDLDNKLIYKHITTLSYSEILPFVFEYLKKYSVTIFIFIALCIISLAELIIIFFLSTPDIGITKIILHSILGLVVLPLLLVPVHELLHIIPYFFTGARNLRIGMDMKQYMFYVTAHRYVVSPSQFKLVAIMPVLIISLIFILLIFIIPGIWKWTFSLSLFVHTTMCAGDFALLNFYNLNSGKEIYSWDDADRKEAYFYERIR